MNDLSLPPPLPILPERERILPRMILPLVLIVCGSVTLGVVSLRESRWMADQPWADALVVVNDETEDRDAIPVWVRRLADDQLPEDEDSAELLRAMEQWEILRDFRMAMKPEHVIAVEMSTNELAPLLASGRLPEAGKPEVLAGGLARFEEFKLGDLSFKVVGRLKPSVSGFVFAYLLPYHANFAAVLDETAGAERGYLLLDGVSRIDELFPPEKTPSAEGKASEDAEQKPETPDADGNTQQDSEEKLETAFIGGQVPTPAAFLWTSFLALTLVAVGGALLHLRLFQYWSVGAPEVFQGVLRETMRFRGLFLGMHVVLYGAFFGSMLASIQFPLLNYWMTYYIGSVFRDGGLGYIGDAYASRNILHATLATFFNNYIVQTLFLTFFTSVIPLALGFVKTLLSFITAGFVMAPVWAGSASGLVFHCITIILELEAYIVAAFAVVAWPIRLFRAAFQPSPGTELMLAVRAFVGAMVLTGVMLGIAAFYEATTLILLRPGF